MNKTTMQLYRELVLADVKANNIPSNKQDMKDYILGRVSDAHMKTSYRPAPQSLRDTVHAAAQRMLNQAQ